MATGMTRVAGPGGLSGGFGRQGVPWEYGLLGDQLNADTNNMSKLREMVVNKLMAKRFNPGMGGWRGLLDSMGLNHPQMNPNVNPAQLLNISPPTTGQYPQMTHDKMRGLLGSPYDIYQQTPQRFQRELPFTLPWLRNNPMVR